AGGSDGGKIEVVEADYDVAHHLQVRRGGQHAGVDAVGQHGDGAGLVGQPRLELVGRQRGVAVVVVDVEMRGEVLDDFRKHLTRNQDPRFDGSALLVTQAFEQFVARHDDAYGADHQHRDLLDLDDRRHE